ncbi:hypothetical protein FDW89_07655 [Citrobacter sp. wls830]|nr:hypothetical protein FDW89_07655 [Citrobacter sp. wls830]TKV10974.1 hypothetical protein FDX04_20110 [Citrobacter sp. wls615]
MHRASCGLIFIDKNNDGSGTLARSPKKSFSWYQNIIRSNDEYL